MPLPKTWLPLLIKGLLMKSFAHWGWTIILLAALMIATGISVFVNFSLFSGMSMELVYAIRYFLVPAVIGVVIAALVSLLSMLVAKNLFKQQIDAFFLPLNCILLTDVVMRIAYPVLDAIFTVLEELSGFSIY